MHADVFYDYIEPTMNTEDMLAAAEFFKSLPSDSLRALAEICIPRKEKKGDIIFLEGNRGSMFFQLVAGKIQLYRLSDEGREVAIKVVKPGEVFGEVILFERDSYPVCASAITNVELLAVPSIQFECLLENRQFRNDFVAMLMRKQRYLTDRIMYLTSSDAESRFFHFLKEQYGNSGTYTIQISKRDISTAIGVTPETLSRLIHKLSDQGILSWSGEKLQVDPTYLKSFEHSGR